MDAADFQREVTEMIAREVAKAREEGIADALRFVRTTDSRIARLEEAVRYLASLQSLPYNIGGDPNFKVVSGHEAKIEEILSVGGTPT